MMKQGIKKIIVKSALYFFILLIVLELVVRVLHLAKDTPSRFLDEHNVEKWIPNQQGYSVTGNRRQNFSEYRINTFGFNSYREFTPTKEKIEVALVGDSFIQGFHQDYYNSIGKKIEHMIPSIEVYEYGYAGYDFADQLHLIHAYKEDFDLIDHVVLGIKFSNDLTRGDYKVMTERLALESPINKLLRKSKLLVYCKSIGILDSPQLLVHQILNIAKPSKVSKSLNEEEIRKEKEKKIQKYIENFESLIGQYGYDMNRNILLLDAKATDPVFMNYLKKNNYKYIDYATYFSTSKKPTTLLYDRHWNDHGRTLIAIAISEYLEVHKN